MKYKTAMIATRHIDWHEALALYRYRVDLYSFTGKKRLPGWFELALSAGDQAETARFEERFRAYAPSHLEAWYEVVFWKMFSQGQWRADFQTERAIERVVTNKTSASILWEHCAEFVAKETKDAFIRFQDLLVEGNSIAIAFTFPAFICPSRFPMVDTRIARYVAVEGSRLDFPMTPDIEKTLKRYRGAAAGVLTLRDWPFVEAWVCWCRRTADRLSTRGEQTWRARDVEMAVFRAWGNTRGRRGEPEYRIFDAIADSNSPRLRAADEKTPIAAQKRL